LPGHFQGRENITVGKARIVAGVRKSHKDPLRNGKQGSKGAPQVKGSMATLPEVVVGLIFSFLIGPPAWFKWQTPQSFYPAIEKWLMPTDSWVGQKPAKLIKIYTGSNWGFMRGLYVFDDRLSLFLLHREEAVKALINENGALFGILMDCKKIIASGGTPNFEWVEVMYKCTWGYFEGYMGYNAHKLKMVTRGIEYGASHLFWKPNHGWWERELVV